MHGERAWVREGEKEIEEREGARERKRGKTRGEVAEIRIICFWQISSAHDTSWGLCHNTFITDKTRVHRMGFTLHVCGGGGHCCVHKTGVCLCTFVGGCMHLCEPLFACMCLCVCILQLASTWMAWGCSTRAVRRQTDTGSPSQEPWGQHTHTNTHSTAYLP